MPNNHKAKCYYSLKSLLEDMIPENEASEWWQKRKDRIIRFWTRLWKRHFLRNGNVPLILRCGLCSGKERKREIKVGKWKVSTRGNKDYKNDISEG